MATLDTFSSTQPQGPQPQAARPPDALDTVLAEVARRVRQQRRMRGGACGLAAALLVDCTLAGLCRADVLPPGPPLWLALALMAAAGALLGAGLAARASLPPMDAARLAEARLPLKERLSSALEFDATFPASLPLLALQHSDAETYARSLDTRQVVPHRLPRELWLALALLLALLLILGLPDLPFAGTPAQRGEQQTVQAAGRALEQAAQAAARRADAAHQPQAAQQARQMERLGRRMAQGHMDRAQALAAVSRQEQQAEGELAPADASQAGSPKSSDPSQAARSLASAAQSPVASSPAAASAKHSSSMPPARSPQAAARPAPTPSSPSGASSASGSQTASAHSASALPKPGASSQQGALPKPGTAGSLARPSSSTAGKGAQKDTSGAASSLRQALQEARRRLAGSPPAQQSASSPPAASAPPQSSAGAGKPSSASSAGAGKSGRQKPGGSASPQAKASGGQAGQSSGIGKPSSVGGPSRAPGQNASGQSASGQSTSGQGASGQGTSGQGTSGGRSMAVKAPFRSTLPPAAPAKNQSLYLGQPSGASVKGTSLPKQSGLPAAPAGPSRVPYGNALPAYRRSAEAALNRAQVPPSQRAVVRDYFNSLPAK